MGTNNSIVCEKAYQFAIRIVKVYKDWVDQKKEYVLSKQLLRSGTSIGANIAEANGAISNADFKNKISIAYKECVETKYWLSLLKDTEYITEKSFNSINADAERVFEKSGSFHGVGCPTEAKGGQAMEAPWLLKHPLKRN